MCGGCGCGCSQCGMIIANTMYVSERLASCCALIAVVGSIILTLITMLGVGIGLGYHYCIVESKTHKLDLQEFKARYYQPDSTTTKAKFLRQRAEDDQDFMVMPLDAENKDFSELIAKIKGRNRNITVQFIAK